MLIIFFGLHGEHVFDSLFNVSFLKEEITSGLTYKQLYDLFVIYGGTGAGLSLIFAIFIAGEDLHSKKLPNWHCHLQFLI